MPRILGEGPTITVAPVAAATVWKPSAAGMVVKEDTSSAEGLKAIGRSPYWWVWWAAGAVGVYFLLRE